MRAKLDFAHYIATQTLSAREIKRGLPLLTKMFSFYYEEIRLRTSAARWKIVPWTNASAHKS